MDEKPFRVHILVTRFGHTGHYHANLVYRDGVPYAVLGPGSEEGTQTVLVALEPKYLHPMKGDPNVTHMYEMPVEDTRPLH